jgi:hypothetical protein
MMSDGQLVTDGIKLARTIIPILTSHKAEVADFALAQSLATLLVAYHPDVRQRMLANHVLLTGRLVPTIDKGLTRIASGPETGHPLRRWARAVIS